MDQASRCWIWEKRNNHHVVRSSANVQESTTTTTNSSYDESSWEEQAFAEDAAGGPEGCIWPPRCYPCSFCRREFRSAQALGGHMNVHRRDRARLKQGAAQPSQVCSSLVCNPNPIPTNFDLLLSPRSDSRVSSVPSIQMKSRDEQSFLAAPYFNNIIQNQHKRSRFSSPQSWSRCNEGRYVHISDPAHETDDEEENNSKGVVDSSGGPCRNNRTSDSGKPDLSVTLNLFVYHSHKTPPSISCGHNEEAVSCKRRKTDLPTVFMSKETSTSTMERHHIQSNVLNLGPFNDLDLELRIGQSPAVE